MDIVSLETNVDLRTSQLSASRQTVKTKHAQTDTQNIADTWRSVEEGPHAFTGMVKLTIILTIARYLRIRMKH